MTLLSLSASAERVWKALCETDEASDQELFTRVRPISRAGFDSAIAELVRGGLVIKEQRD